MATVTLQGALDTTDFWSPRTGSAIQTTVTTYEFQNAAGHFVVVSGAALTYSGDDPASGGSYTTISIYADAGHATTLATYGSTTAIDFGTYFTSGPATALAGNDSITGSTGNDTVAGSLGNDTFDGGTGLDLVDYSATTWRVTVSLGTAGEVYAGSVLVNEIGIDTLHGIEAVTTGSGDDQFILTGLLGIDARDNTLSGGAGTDVVDYGDNTTKIVFTIGPGGTGTVTSSEIGTDSFSGFEWFTSGSGDATFVMSSNADEQLIAGTGSNTLSYVSATAGITVTLNNLNWGTAADDGTDVGTDQIFSFAHVITGSGDDVFNLTETTGRTIEAGGGKNTANYSASTESVTVFVGGGGTGATVDNVFSIASVIGSAGDDEFDMNDVANNTIDGSGASGGLDHAVYATATKAITVNLYNGGNGSVTGADVGVDTLIAIGGVTGGAGNDTFQSTDKGSNAFSGEDGTDTISYEGVATSIVLDLKAGTATGADVGTDTLTSIENVIGGSGDDSLAGSLDANLILGFGGSDTIRGGGGADSLDGNNGFDVVSYAQSPGTAGVGITVNLTQQGTGTADEPITTGTAQKGGDAQGDLLWGFEGVIGSQFKDLLTGDANANLLSGGDGNDTIDGGAGNDTITGGDGSDLLKGGAGVNLLSFAGADFEYTVNLALGTAKDASGADTISGFQNVLGGIGADKLTGDKGANRIEGGAGDDTIEGGAGADTLIGGGGQHDTVSYAGSTLGVNVDLNEAVLAKFFSGAIPNGDASEDSLSGFSDVIGSSKADLIVGDANDNVLSGGLGADTLVGGGGFDTASYETSKAGVSINLTTNVNSGGDAQGDKLSGIETVFGSDANDTLTGDSADNWLDGSAGNDLLAGGAGADTLRGAAGNDVLAGGADADSLDGGSGLNTLSYAGDTTGVSVSFFGSILFSGLSNSGGDAEGDVINFDNFSNLAGGSGGDRLITDNGNNSIAGGLGNDTIEGLGGNDTLDGGGVTGNFGKDLLSYEHAGGSITVDLSKTSAQDTKGAGIDTIKGFENVLGSDFSDALTGDKGANLLTGGGGADTLKGMDGNDTLDGGSKGATDQLIGGKGDDVYRLIGETETVVEIAGEGSDTIQTDLASLDLAAYANVENVTYVGGDNFTGAGTALDNRLVGGEGDDSLTGLAGNDTLDAGAVAAIGDTLVGGEGSDVYVIRHGSVLLIETGAGAKDLDAIHTTLASFSLGGYATIENLTLIGTTGQSGIGNDLANVITGSARSDSLDGGGNDGKADTLAGGLGSDTYTVYAGDAVIEQALPPSDLNNDLVQTALSAYTLSDGVERLTYTGSASFVGTGNTADNRIIGACGADTLSGLTGDDDLHGGLGSDSLVGGDGNDQLYGDSTIGTGDTSADTLDGGAGNDRLDGGNDSAADLLKGSAGNDLYILRDNDVISELTGGGIDTVWLQTTSTTYTLSANVENLFYTDAGNLDITGNALANVLTGNVGEDLLRGLDGNDTLDGGGDIAIIDTLYGGKGDDLYLMRGDVADEIVELFGEGTKDTAWSYIDALKLDANVEIGAIKGGAVHALRALTGNDLANVLTGDISDDTLDGGADASAAIVDQLKGGKGDDVYIVRGLNDKITELAGEGTDTVRIAPGLTAYTLGINLENLIFTHDGDGQNVGVGNTLDNALTGNTAADTLSGLLGNDTLTGDAGNDALNGGVGNDRLIGGAGADTFVFNMAPNVATNLDTIVDFEVGVDKISLAKSVFSGIAVTGPLTAGTFALATDVSAADDRIIYDAATGALYYDKDGSGGALKIQIATLANAPGLTAGDFLVT